MKHEKRKIYIDFTNKNTKKLDLYVNMYYNINNNTFLSGGKDIGQN